MSSRSVRRHAEARVRGLRHVDPRRAVPGAQAGDVAGGLGADVPWRPSLRCSNTTASPRSSEIRSDWKGTVSRRHSGRCSARISAGARLQGPGWPRSRANGRRMPASGLVRDASCSTSSISSTRPASAWISTPPTADLLEALRGKAMAESATITACNMDCPAGWKPVPATIPYPVGWNEDWDSCRRGSLWIWPGWARAQRSAMSMRTPPRRNRTPNRSCPWALTIGWSDRMARASSSSCSPRRSWSFAKRCSASSMPSSPLSGGCRNFECPLRGLAVDQLAQVVKATDPVPARPSLPTDGQQTRTGLSSSSA